MGNLLKVVACGIGCVYLLMHVAYALTSVADNIRNHRGRTGQTIPRGHSHELDGDATAQYHDTVGLEQRTSS